MNDESTIYFLLPILFSNVERHLTRKFQTTLSKSSGIIIVLLIWYVFVVQLNQDRSHERKMTVWLLVWERFTLSMWVQNIIERTTQREKVSTMSTSNWGLIVCECLICFMLRLESRCDVSKLENFWLLTRLWVIFLFYQKYYNDDFAMHGYRHTACVLLLV